VNFQYNHWAIIMGLKKYTFSFLLLLVLIPHAFAQTSFHITSAQGLSTNQLTILTKDAQSNMWFGSYNGLHKHEGTSIKVYNKSGKDAASLSSKEVHAVFIDRLGKVWAGTTGGLDKLDPKTGVIVHYQLKDSTHTDDQIGYIVSIFQDEKDAIWVVTEAGIFIVNYQSGKYRQLRGNERTSLGMPDYGVMYKGAVKTQTGIWMYASGYLIFYEFKSGRFFHQYNNPGHKKVFDLRAGNNFDSKSELCADANNNLYFIFNNNILMKYNIVTDKLDSFHFDFPKNAWNCCYSLAADFKGNIWIGFRYGGILYFDNSTHSFTTIRYNDINSLTQSDYVYSLCEDYLKRMWVTTNNGIFIINYYDSIVKQKYLSGKKEFININYSAAIISQDNQGNIYVPFLAGGLFKYNVFNGNNNYYPVGNAAIKEFGYVYTGEKDKIFVSAGTALLKADMVLNEIRLSASKEKMFVLLSAVPARVSWIYKHNDKAIYIKKSDGYFYYYNGTDSLKSIESAGFYRLACVSADSSFLFFITEEGDVVKRNLETLKMDTIFLYKKLRALNFSYANVRDMADDGNGNLWVTSQNGLIKYNWAAKKVVVYTTANGLLHDFSFTLCVDSKKRLWVGSMGGVNLFDPKENTFLNVFPESPDKLSNYFGSSLEAKDGHIYFLFGGKLVNINPDAFFKQHIAERLLQLDEVAVNGNKIDTSSNILDFLSYNENRIYFRFGLLEFTEPEKVKYYAMLQGLDKEWVDLGNHAEITFNSLQPGQYIFKVKATDVYGNVVKSQLEVPFIIQQPFWKTWWFILFFIVLTLFCIFMIVKWRERNLKKIESAKTKLQQLTAEKYKTQFESEQISRFFTTSMLNKNDVDDVLWDVAKNLISKLGFVDCIIYLWNADKTKLVQKAGYGSKGSIEELTNNRFEVEPGSGIVGTVAQTGTPLLVPDTQLDKRYIIDDEERLSEICVPIKYDEEVLGVIDSEHFQKNFFTSQHMQALSTIATLVASKIKAIEADQRLRHQKAELADINQQLAEVQLAALRSQMNPHFIFNALNSIKKFVIANEPANAEKYLGKFSKLIRTILDNSQGGMVTVEKEVQLLKLYLDLEQLRFGERLSYTIEVDESLNTGDTQIPSMIVQPFVENAMLHGIMHRDNGGKVTVVFSNHTDWLQITIEDNGVGRKSSAAFKSENAEPHHSIGIEVATKRLIALKKNNDTPAGIEIIDLVDETGQGLGTKVMIAIPIY